MAFKVASVQHLTASSPAAKITLPTDGYNGASSWASSIKVIFIFDDSHTSDFELVESGSTEGLQVKANTQYQSGPWLLHNNSDNIPRYVYASGSVPCRVTVLLSR